MTAQFIEATEADRGERADRFLSRRVPELSRSRIQALIEAGHITVDAVALKPSHRLRGDEQIRVEVPRAVEAAPQPEALPLKVLHDDADLLVVDKAAGMVVHPGAGHHSGTLVNALLHHVTDLKGVGGELRPGIVHRLDKDTSGVMVVAKHETALQALQRSFASREVEKVYLAIVAGHPPDEGTFHTLHGRHPVHRQRFTGRVRTGKVAITHYRVKQRLAGAALMEITLETGRTHQIRVHFSEAGHPLLADPIYGGRAARVEAVPRLALHAHRLAFDHPRTGRRLKVVAALPDDLAAAVRALR